MKDIFQYQLLTFNQGSIVEEAQIEICLIVQTKEELFRFLYTLVTEILLMSDLDSWYWSQLDHLTQAMAEMTNNYLKQLELQWCQGTTLF